MRIMYRARTFVRLSLTLLLVQSVTCDWKPNNPKKEKLCSTKECTDRGKLYKDNMAAQIHPCQDFYSFTCGNFRNTQPHPKYAAEWSVVDSMNHDFATIVRDTLEKYKVRGGDNIEFRITKQTYETCLKIPEYIPKASKDVCREIMKIGRVPNTPLWDIHLKYLELTGESAFFDFKILANMPADGIPLLMLTEPSSAYGSILHEQDWKPQEQQSYTEFLFQIMKSLKLTGSDKLIRERVETVLEFRKKLNKIIARHFKKKPDYFLARTAENLDMWFSRTPDIQTKTQDIPWTEIVNVLLQNLDPHIRSTLKVVAMRQSQYFLDLRDLLKDESEEVLGFHMEIYFVERHLILNDKMSKLLEATSVEPHGLTSYIREKQYPKWHKCLQDLGADESLEKLLFYKWFPKTYVQPITEMIANLKAAINLQMWHSTWLDGSTRDAIRSRLRDLETWIGFPPWIIGFATPKPRNKKEILTPNASLNVKQKRIYIHAPLLVDPLFSLSMPGVYNYGGMGATLGHELYHIMDDCGSYNEDGKAVYWWPANMGNKCEDKRTLFIERYNNITDREFKNRYGLVVKSDTSRTFVEDLPDVMGLEAAYNAYVDLSSKDPLMCKTLPNFEKYSCEQMFYIAFANTFCGYTTSKRAKKNLDTWDHSVDSIRINGAVSQMESFSKVFGCAAGTPMNPEEKMNLWK